MSERYFENREFTSLQLTGETIKYFEFIDCTFIDCTIEKCTIAKCRFSECTFVNCHISDIKFDGTETNYLAFENCILSGVNWGLLTSSGGFSEPVNKLKSCNLKYNFFTDMNLKKFSFKGNDITYTTFADCNLIESNFDGCNLTDTEFFRCDIQKADFRNASGYKIDVITCNIKKAKFSAPEVYNLLDSLDIKIE